MFFRTNGENRGRDGCRVPLPWSGQRPPFGFSPPGAQREPWLPQPLSWRDRTVAAQTGDPGSMLTLYRRALACRRRQPALGDGEFGWLPAPDGVLAFSRGRDGGLVCVVNLSDRPVEVPVSGTVVLASVATAGGLLPPDGAVWVASD